LPGAPPPRESPPLPAPASPYLLFGQIASPSPAYFLPITDHAQDNSVKRRLPSAFARPTLNQPINHSVNQSNSKSAQEGTSGLQVSKLVWPAHPPPAGITRPASHHPYKTQAPARLKIPHAPPPPPHHPRASPRLASYKTQAPARRKIPHTSRTPIAHSGRTGKPRASSAMRLRIREKLGTT